MARSAKFDPIEKFRFKVSVIAIDFSLIGAAETLSNFTPSNNPIKLFTRAGFNKITTPKATVTEINYRENIDNNRFIKVPGLVKYEPITLSRGVTRSRDLYDWYRLVNDELALLSVAQELNRDAQYTPIQSSNFRKDVFIQALNRKGHTVKAWYLFNAWPTAYSPGNDFDANSEEKLVEELTLTYEFFLEIEGDEQSTENGFGGLSEGFVKELAKSGVIVAGEEFLFREIGNMLDKIRNNLI